MRVLALSSGTSVDGIDVAVADLALERDTVLLTPVAHREVAFSTRLRAQILECLPPARCDLEQVCRIDTTLGQELAAAARTALDELATTGDDVPPQLVVSHGQTLFHWVEEGSALGTLQLGQPAWIAGATGLPVVSDVRINDIVAGGQGAPLASLLDVLLLADRAEPAAALNLGGIANVTVAGGGVDPVAFDTGPANALIDAAVGRATGGREHVDLDGALAATGRVHEDLLATLLDLPYYAEQPPKSTGKELFHAGHLEAALQATGSEDLPTADLLATLVELTAVTVADALAPFGVGVVFASGGGTRNPTLLRRLSDRLAPARVDTVESLGLDSSAKEAYLFALIGFLSWHGLPGTVASCTGAARPTVAGRITPGAQPLHMPPPASESPRVLHVVSAAG